MALENATSTASYAASAFTTIYGLSVNEWVALGGFLLGLGTFLTNVWYRRQQLKLQRELGVIDPK